MKIAIMQPYFFPYLGYFSLIKHTDKFIVFDPVQFIRHGWIERNRILKPAEGWQYIAVPLEKHSREIIIKDIKIRVKEEWEEKIFRQLLHYKKAPHFSEVFNLISTAINIPTDSIVKLNTNILTMICRYLNVPFKATIYSEMNLVIDPIKNAGHWALNICKALGGNEYINPIGGVEIFDRSEFEEMGINLKFINLKLGPYNQNRNNFEQGLSIIDVMMFNSVDQIEKMLNNYEFV